MKAHRWVVSMVFPASPLCNEDNDYYLKIDSSNEEHAPTTCWCFDCEQYLGPETFGQPCPGYSPTGGKDDRMPDIAWKGLI